MTNTFGDDEEIVRFQTSVTGANNGVIDIQTFPEQAPQTVTNFLTYVNNSSASLEYDAWLIHRVLTQPGLSIVQGGGFHIDQSGSGGAGGRRPARSRPSGRSRQRRKMRRRIRSSCPREPPVRR